MKNSLLTAIALPIMLSARPLYTFGYNDGIRLGVQLSDAWGVATEWQVNIDDSPDSRFYDDEYVSADLFISINSDIAVTRKIWATKNILINAYAAVPFRMMREDDTNINYDYGYNGYDDREIYSYDTTLTTDYTTGIEGGIEPHFIIFERFHIFTRIGVTYLHTYSRQYVAYDYTDNTYRDDTDGFYSMSFNEFKVFGTHFSLAGDLGFAISF